MFKRGGELYLLAALLAAIWIHVAQSRLLNFSGEAELKLNLAPSLSGPSQPQIETSSTDPWGLIQIRQAINPLRLLLSPVPDMLNGWPGNIWRKQRPEVEPWLLC